MKTTPVGFKDLEGLFKNKPSSKKREKTFKIERIIVLFKKRKSFHQEREKKKHKNKRKRKRGGGLPDEATLTFVATTAFSSGTLA